MTEEPTDTEVLPAGPAPDGRDASFWNGLSSGRLMLPRCTACGTWGEPGRDICPVCWSFDLGAQAVPATGTIFSMIRTHRRFVRELDVPPPYTTVLVALDAAPIRLLGILLGEAETADRESPPAIGTAVVGVVLRPANSEWPVVRWRAVDAAS